MSRSFLRNTVATIKKLRGDCEKSMNSKFKRNETLNRLNQELQHLQDPRSSSSKLVLTMEEKVMEKIAHTVPDLKRVFEFRDILQREQQNFKEDDFFKTLEEQIDNLYFQACKERKITHEEFWRSIITGDLETERRKQIKVGDQIRHFEYFNNQNQKVSTKELLENGNCLVLGFFCGAWNELSCEGACCKGDCSSKFKALNTRLISIGIGEKSTHYFKKGEVIGEYGYLESSNSQKETAKKYGLSLETCGTKYKELVNQIEEQNQNACVSYLKQDWIPIPGIYVFNNTGKCVLAYSKLNSFKKLARNKIIEALYYIAYNIPKSPKSPISEQPSSPQSILKKRKRKEDDQGFALRETIQPPKKRKKIVI